MLATLTLEVAMTEIVVFDLDGTLLSGDSTQTWLIGRLRSNIFRCLLAILVIPIAIPILFIKKRRALGISLFLWIATYGLTEEQLKQSFQSFAMSIRKHTARDLHWFEQGIAEINGHLTQGRRVIIATAAPEMLAEQLMQSMDLEVHVIGSTLSRQAGGWICTRHCRHDEKLQRLKQLDIQIPWRATYSDDVQEDYPILTHSLQAYSINADQHKRIKKPIKGLIDLKWG